MSKTNYLQAVISDLQRTAGPYRCAKMKIDPNFSLVTVPILSFAHWS